MNILEAIEVMDPATIQILAKEFGKAAKDTRHLLEPGTTVYVDETVACDVSGGLRTGEDYRQRIVNAVDWIGFSESLLDSLNRTIAAARKNEAILRFCPPQDRDTVHLAGLASGDLQIELEKSERKNDGSKGFERDVKGIMEAIKGTTERDCKGKVTTTDASVLVILQANLDGCPIEDRLDLWDAEERAARLQELNG